MREHTKSVIVFRQIVLALAVFFALRMLVLNSVIAQPFGPFRYLTYWANLLGVICAWLMLRRSLGRSTARYDGLVAASAVVGVLVVYLYWSLYLKNPFSVTTDGGGSWWTEYYYHGLGPVLLWIDALFILRGFRAPLRAVLWLSALVVGWISFVELAVQPLNSEPAGSVTSGLPYPFLNNMEQAERLTYYGMNIAVAFVVLAVLSALALGIRRVKGP